MSGIGFFELLIVGLVLLLLFAAPIAVIIIVVVWMRSTSPSAIPTGAHAKPPAASPFVDHAHSSAEVVAQITQRFCPQCRAPLAADAPEGLCPACLMAGGMASAVDVHSEKGLAVTTPPSASQPPTTGEWTDLAQRFPHLEILELLGRGGMGAVYKARQKQLDRMIALKVIPPDAAKDPAFAERFGREARAMARLNHPNIVTVYDFGQIDGVYYLLMEYVDGVNLRQAQRASRLAPNEALAIVPQICDALQYAHDQGVVHRDIKPENVLLDRSGRVKIADFGLAKMLGKGPDDFTLTRTQQVMGTPRYMAPEQIERPSAVDHRADIYSLGVVLYEMLTGELPIGRFEPPSHKVQLDVRIDEVVLRTLEKEPDRRYQRASQLKTELASAASWPSLGVPVGRESNHSSPWSAAPPTGIRPQWQTPVPMRKANPPAYAGRPVGLAILMIIVMAIVGLWMLLLGVGSFNAATFWGAEGTEPWWFVGGGIAGLLGGIGLLVGAYRRASWLVSSGGQAPALREASYGPSESAFPWAAPPAAKGAVDTAPLKETLAVAIGMVLGVLLIIGGVAVGIYALITVPPFDGAWWGWMGSAFGCTVGGFGSVAGSYNTYRQMSGAVDLMRSPDVTWFDWVMRGFFAFGLLLLGIGITASIAEGRPGNVGYGTLLLGGISAFQAGLFLIYRMLLRPAGLATPTDPKLAALRRRVRGPAIGLIVTGVLGLTPLMFIFMVFVIAALAPYLAGSSASQQGLHSVGFGAVEAISLLFTPLAATILFGGIQMWHFRNYTLVKIAAVFALLPCSCSWITGLEMGIWALVVLGDSEVRSAFDEAERAHALGKASKRRILLPTLAIATAIFFVVGALVMLGIQSDQQSRKATQARFAQTEFDKKIKATKKLAAIGMALRLYHDAYHCFPPAVTNDTSGKPLSSGRVLLLPFLGEHKAYNEFHLNQPWNSRTVEGNWNSLNRTTEVYCATGYSPYTDFLFVAGRGTVFDPERKTTIGDITDDPARTIVMVEIKDSHIHWSEPREIDLGQPGPPLPAGHFPGGNLALMADGSVGWLPRTLLPSQLHALATIAGGESTSFLDDEFDLLLQALQRETSDTGRVAFIKSAVKTHGFKCEQARKLLWQITNDANREEAAVALYPGLTDQEKFFTVLEVFNNDAHRQSVREQLKLQ